MQGHQLSNGLHLEDDDVLDEEIDAVAHIELHSVVDDGQGKFYLNPQSPFPEFVEETRFVGTLDLTRFGGHRN